MSDFKPQDARYAKLIDRYSRYVESPVLRLKFLNNTLRSSPPRNFWSRAPFVGSLPERMMLIMELSKVLPPAGRAPLALRVTALLYRLRAAVYAASLALVLAAGSALVYVASRMMSNLSTSTQAKDLVSGKQPALNQSAAAGAIAAIDPGAELSLDKVWLAEAGDGYEFYSNGARVLTEFEITGDSRRYYRFNVEGLSRNSEQFEIDSKPVGILYHLSESDLLPFADRYNASLQGRSKSLLDYAREKRLYNYLIDRFGRTYRIVGDEFAANHAGNSVWSDGNDIYVNLSSSFIGICFEGNSGGEAAVGPDAVNEAQIYAARVLTAVLRSKHGIKDANCVTHGLVSVNPSNMLVGYHTDWVSGFPFRALGLTNKYDSEMASVADFGFRYDQAYVAAAGGARWAGLDRSDARLSGAAKSAARTVEDERRARQQFFQRAYRKQRELEQEIK